MAPNRSTTITHYVIMSYFGAFSIYQPLHRQFVGPWALLWGPPSVAHASPATTCQPRNKQREAASVGLCRSEDKEMSSFGGKSPMLTTTCVMKHDLGEAIRKQSDFAPCCWTQTHFLKNNQALNTCSQVTHNPQWWCASRQFWWKHQTWLLMLLAMSSFTRLSISEKKTSKILQGHPQESQAGDIYGPPSRCPTVQMDWGGQGMSSFFWTTADLHSACNAYRAAMGMFMHILRTLVVPHPIFAPPLKTLTKLRQTFSRWCFQRIWKRLVKMWIFPKKGWKQKTLETTSKFWFAFWRPVFTPYPSVPFWSACVPMQAASHQRVEMRGLNRWGGAPTKVSFMVTVATTL